MPGVGSERMVIRSGREVRNNNKPAGTNTPEDIDTIHIYRERDEGESPSLHNKAIQAIQRKYIPDKTEMQHKRRNRAGTMQPASGKRAFQLVSL